MNSTDTMNSMVYGTPKKKKQKQTRGSSECADLRQGSSSVSTYIFVTPENFVR